MSVSYRYANALCKAGVEKGVLDKIEEDFTWFMKAYKEDQNLKKVFENPLIDDKEKKAFINALLKEKNKELKNFLMLLIDRKREKELPFIYESFMDKAREENNRVLCKAITVYELNEEEKKNLANTLRQVTNKVVELENIVDKSIMGGIVVNVGDRVYDYSVKGQLNEVRTNLLKTSLAKVG